MSTAERNTKPITPELRRETLQLWDSAVAVRLARIRAMSDDSITTDEYCALSQAALLANVAAVRALGGYPQFTCPDGVSLGGDR